MSRLHSSSRSRVREYRARLRKQGLRPIQIWVPDVRAPRFALEAHRQSRAVAASRAAVEDQAFVDAISDRSWETLPSGANPHLGRPET
ncbi:MAG TPA: antitoxin MazE family protein [Solirubrobacteraceae bacterium]